jgi:hypothetical protein
MCVYTRTTFKYTPEIGAEFGVSCLLGSGAVFLCSCEWFQQVLLTLYTGFILTSNTSANNIFYHKH